MLSRLRDFGFSIGQLRPIPTENLSVSLESGGVDHSVSAAQLEEGGSANATDIRFIGGGISTDFGSSPLSTAYTTDSNRSIQHIAPFELEDATQFLMRVRPTGVDRWNGANWFTLPGLLTASIQDLVYSTVQSGRFIIANGIDKLKAWDGNDATGLVDLSADAPIAYYVTRIGTRLMVARCRDSGGTLRPNLLAWSADDNIFNWTDPLLGAGQAEPIPEGSGRKPNFVTGLSTLARGAVIYRQAAIQLGLLTGQGAAPFRFTTVDFSHGTESPYSIANGGMQIGDFFLGSDFMPYTFNGESAPMPIGGAIHDELLRTIPDLRRVVGAVDTNEQQYWLGYPADDTTILSVGWVFDIRKFATKQKLVWRKKTLPPNLKTLGFGNVVASIDPIVDTVATIVESDPTRVDDYARNTGHDRLMFGNSLGQVSYRDPTVAETNGIWTTKQFTHPNGHTLTIDRTRIRYTSSSGATVAISVSVDGANSFSTEKFLTLSSTGLSGVRSMADHRITGSSFIVRIRPVAGFITITELEVTFQNLGAINE